MTTNSLQLEHRYNTFLATKKKTSKEDGGDINVKRRTSINGICCRLASESHELKQQTQSEAELMVHLISFFLVLLSACHGLHQEIARLFLS